MLIENYFDNAASTPMDPRVIEAMTLALREDFGNERSIHQMGTRARERVEQARSAVATLFGADSPDQIIFTSGATEANNLAINSASRSAFSPFVHPSVSGPCLLREGREVQSWEAFSGDLYCSSRIDGETGMGVDIRPDAPTLDDGAQLIGKLPYTVEKWMNFSTCSAHKFYGPKGIGALYCADPTTIRPLLLGGGHEHGLRSGTLNVPAIVGFGTAAEIAAQELTSRVDHACACRRAFLNALANKATFRVNESDPATQSPYILSITFPGIVGETLVVECDSVGFAISAGSACSDSMEKSSSILRARGLSKADAQATVRVSFGQFNTVDASIQCAKALARAAVSLQSRAT